MYMYLVLSIFELFLVFCFIPLTKDVFENRFTLDKRLSIGDSLLYTLTLKA